MASLLPLSKSDWFCFIKALATFFSYYFFPYIQIIHFHLTWSEQLVLCSLLPTQSLSKSLRSLWLMMKTSLSILNAHQAYILSFCFNSQPILYHLFSQLSIIPVIHGISVLYLWHSTVSMLFSGISLQMGAQRTLMFSSGRQHSEVKWHKLQKQSWPVSKSLFSNLNNESQLSHWLNGNDIIHITAIMKIK